MNLPRPHPNGFHVEHFDTTLVEQVIAVEIERAARYAGVILDSDTTHEWGMQVLDRVMADVSHDLDSHVMMPEELDHHIHDEVALLIDIRRESSASQGMPMLDPMRGMKQVYGRMAVLCRSFFDKRLE